MAVDTAAKRFSMLNFAGGSHIHLTFQTDGQIDADDRIQLLDLYNGFSLTGDPAPPVSATRGQMMMMGVEAAS